MSSSPALSPADSSQDAAEGQKAGHEQITFRFCSECSNMLYPKEDEENRCLKFVCRTCHYTEPAASSCVYRNVLNNAAGDTAGVTQDVTSDPTLPRAAKSCLECSHQDAVFFQSQQRSAETGMNLYYVCCNCGLVYTDNK